MIYFILAIILLSLAHISKVLRQAEFIEIYECPNKKELSKAMSISYMINFVLPFKVGNIFRIIYPGRKMKNGVSFSLATIIIDLLLDFYIVCIIYIILKILGINSVNLSFYVLISLLTVFLILIFTMFKKYIKKMILAISGIFNNNIELKLLKTSWYTITSFKDMLQRINKLKLLIYTIIPWILYVLSYLALSMYFSSINENIKFVDIFNMFYGEKNLLIPTLSIINNNFGLTIAIYLCIYIFIPIFVIYIISYCYKNKKYSTKKYIELLPHINVQDKLLFLEGYFKADNRDYFKKYIELNNDIAIIEDYSAGSNATTMLCSKDGNLFYRKYSFGTDAEKLYEQIKWIHKHEKKLTLTKIINEYYKDGVCSYDMPYVQGAVTCFNYVHTMPFDETWKIIKLSLDDIDKNLHSINRRKSDIETIDKYVDSKVLKNIEKIEKGSYIKPLMKYDYIYINGKKYHNLEYFKKYLNKEYLEKVFKNDYYSDIHGDFTIENIICKKDNKEGKGYYIIDPNTGNLHDSPYLDYGKLLQSIHGGYEFLMNTKTVSYNDNRIDFLFTKSSKYYKLFDEYVNYLENKFGKKGLKSIFYHEVIHWLRLMPYKIEKNGDRSLLFYAGLIIVMSDVEKRFEK